MKIKLNGKDIEIPGGYKVLDILKTHSLLGKPLVVELNGVILNASQFEAVFFKDGDSLEIVRLVGGG